MNRDHEYHSDTLRHFEREPFPRRIHMIGVGGAGMAPLAEILLGHGVEVSGSDLEDSAKCEKLRRLGAKIAPAGHRAENFPQTTVDAVIRTSACPEDNVEFAIARARNIPIYRRGEFLAEVAKRYRDPVAISGSHGKTTTTAMLSFVLERAGRKPGFYIGGELPGFPDCAIGDGDIFVTEADESDATHVFLSGSIALVPNVDDDHAWGLGGVEALNQNFKHFAAHFRTVVYVASPRCDELFASHPGAIRLDAAELARLKGCLSGNLVGFLRTNAALALKAAELLGVSPEQGGALLAEFPGVERRMSERFRSKSVVIVEDYAHHPEELRSSLAALGERYGNEKNHWVVFQVHRYARLERYFEEYAAILSPCPHVLLAPLFAAWSEKGERTIAELRDRIVALGGHAELLGEVKKIPDNEPQLWQKGAAQLEKAVESALHAGNETAQQKPFWIAVIGAGSVTRLIPELKKTMEKI